MRTLGLTRRQFIKRGALYVPLAYAAINVYPRPAHGADIVAASAALSAVQAAVNAASDGDRVLIPNGTVTWSGGISTSKQIRIQAQNYTPTPMGAATRNVMITNNSSAPLFEFTSGNAFHVGLGGIGFKEGTGNVNHFRFNGTGSKVPLIYDCYFRVKQRNGNQPDIAAVALLSIGGVIWNCMGEADSLTPGPLGVGPDGASIIVNSPRAWATPSTLGALDVGGVVNWYVEDSSFFNFGQSPDVDDNGRIVIRHCLLDGVSGLTHGFSSAFGGRHFEYYNNTFTTTTNDRNVAGRYFWARAGHGIFTDNVVNTQNRGYGSPQLMDSIVESGAAYPVPRQVGWGHNGTSSVIDPIYIWNQSGAGAYDWSTTSPTYIKANREVFANVGAKPGYSKFTYPHPLRRVVEDSGLPPLAPTGLTLR